jgi:heterodisulfide reductase subunit C
MTDESAPAPEPEEAGARAREPSGPEITPSGEFLREVEEATGQSLSACFQCRKCTCGCPLNEDTDIHPNKLLRLIQLGRREEVLASKAIWLCVGCETCTARCPNGVNISQVMDHLRLTAIREGIAPADPKVAKFHQAFLQTLRKYGRSHEIDMIRRYKLKTGTFFENMGLGIEMWRKGKIKILGRKIEDLQAFREMVDSHRSRE